MDQHTTTTSWQNILGSEKKQPYFQAILKHIQQQKNANKTVYPPNDDIFNALKFTSYQDTKVVIIGQDPYHGPGQAHGLSFSVKAGITPPPSLVNIFKELQTDLNITPPDHGCLKAWATQGVLLLNASLTVEAHQPQSHANIGWHQFTDTVISELNNHTEPLVFMLWGSFAHKKCAHIDGKRHCILKAPHPSPLSAYRGYYGCKHFSKANTFLITHNRNPINWQL